MNKFDLTINLKEVDLRIFYDKDDRKNDIEEERLYMRDMHFDPFTGQLIQM